MPVYDPEKEKEDIFKTPITGRGGQHDDLRTHPERREAEVADLEKSYTGSGHDKQTQAEQKAVTAASGGGDGSSGGGLYKGGSDSEEPKRKGIRGWSNKKKAATGGGVLATIFTIAILSIPGLKVFEFLHLSNFLQDTHFGNNNELMEGRVGRLIRYARGADAHRSNLGVTANRVADRYEAKLRRAGFEISYDDPVNGRNTGSIQTLTVDPETPQGRRALQTMRENGVDIPSANADGKIVFSLRGSGSTTTARAVLGASVESLRLGKISSWMSLRLLKKRASVTYHWMNKPREKFEDTVDGRRAQNEETREQIEENVSEGAQDIPEGDRAVAQDTDEPNPEIDDANESVRAASAGDNAADIAGSLKGAAGRGASALGVLIIICSVDKFGDNIAAFQQSNVVLPLLRVGVQAISTGSQVASGQGFTSQQLSVFAEQLYDPETGLDWAAADSIRAEMGKPVSNSEEARMPETAKPKVDRPAFFETLDDVINNLGANQACDFLTSTIGGYVADGVDIALALVTGGGWGAVRAAGGALIGNIGGAAAEPFLEDLARTLAGESVESYAQGALFGNYANYGSRLAANDGAVAVGGRELPDSESTVLDQDRENRNKTALQNKNWYSRYIDPKEQGSLFARTILEEPIVTSSSTLTSTVAQLPVKIMSSLSSSFSSLAVGRSHAVEPTPYDYGFPEYGFTLAELEGRPFGNQTLNESIDNPYQNASIVEPQLENLNEQYGDCFNTKVEADGSFTTEESLPMGEIPDDCDDDNEMLIRYRYYIADTVANATLTCYDGIDEGKCSDLGFDSGGDEGAATPDGPVGPEDIVDIPGLGAGRGCHRSIAEKTRQMLEAATAAGVPLTGNCWRSTETQEQLRAEHGCGGALLYDENCTGSPPTAVPGRSNHEKGLAIDFDNCRSQSTPCWQWLNANAAQYGFQNLRSEPWHWSVDGR